MDLFVFIYLYSSIHHRKMYFFSDHSLRSRATRALLLELMMSFSVFFSSTHQAASIIHIFPPLYEPPIRSLRLHPPFLPGRLKQEF